ncbi:1-aminocyclopropane-1-carboxylate deaminase [Blastomyces parvus]|uniref:1-aminocyclopropane-1-carboxylate deaminase n=1 Tax=Blastomyces parvus TaxID=2060905 RepID=A0A2B7X5L9_9EURO|nr:1-aminocyclopropane-1-carboxylate deaminase [Blastomyces parvus]
MAPAAPSLPTRFPCWCQAVYSWGGETKRDLGFVEGDLIECLNAGDGSWWTGRLRRDKRMVGVFPSNFVKVLGDDFVPGSRSVSPMPGGPAGSTMDLRRISASNSAAAPRKQKTFRKPFQGYKEVVGPSEALRKRQNDDDMKNNNNNNNNINNKNENHINNTGQTVSPSGKLSKARPGSAGTPPASSKHRGSLSRQSPRHSPHSVSPAPVQHRSSISRAISPSPGQHAGPISRAISPAPIQHRGSFSHHPPRAASPLPVRHHHSFSNPTPHTVSAAPMQHRGSFSHHNRAISPVPVQYHGSVPRALSPSPVQYNPSFSNPHPRALSPGPIQHHESISRAVSPSPMQHHSLSNSHPRALSPGPIQHHHSYSHSHPRALSPGPPRDTESPPPPPPPPHRISVKTQPRRPSQSPIPTSYDMNHVYPTVARTPSPHPHSPAIYGHTPSPLRDAMEDVMSSLQDMGLNHDGPSEHPRRSPSPFHPWSPEAFDTLHENGVPNPIHRPLTSSGLSGGDDQQQESSQHNFAHQYNDGPPQLNNYVQRMESRLRKLHAQSRKSSDELHMPPSNKDLPPIPPPKGSSHSRPQSASNQDNQGPRLRPRRSAYELGKDVLGRTFTTKSSATTSSSGAQSNATSSTSSTGRTDQSVMSGPSASAFSATSAASYARHTNRPNTAMDNIRPSGLIGSDKSSDSGLRPQTPLTGISYHSSHDSSRQGATSAVGWNEYSKDAPSMYGGLTTPKSKKTGFFKKIIESAKTGAATARSNIGTSPGGAISPTKSRMAVGISSYASPHSGKPAARDTGLGASVDWVQVRRDVNRCTTPSHHELIERAERCQMLDCPVIYAVEELYESAEGDEGIDGLPIAEPTNWAAVNLQLVDKSVRFISSLPAMINATGLSQGYICRPHRSDGQRLRAIFTWVAERIAWDDDIDGDVDLKRVLSVKRASPKEVAYLVQEMCSAVGLDAEVVHGYLKTPGEQLDLDRLSHPNHWWNAVLIDGEWRIMDCSLASPTHPRRSLYSSFNSQAAESWYFLARPMEICYSHVPIDSQQQHICPPVSPDVLLALPCACPPFFKNGLRFPNYDTSLIRINGLEAVQLRIHVPPDVECVAEVEALVFDRDMDGDFFENGDISKKRALAQPDWIGGQKRFTIKAVLPGDEGQGVLKVYVGKKGLMHSIKDIPHPLAFALPITHTGDNPTYDFILRHPTPHAQRHDLYVIQPQCAKLAVNNTFVFAVRQHPSSLPSSSPNPNDANGRISPNPYARPASALSMVSSVAASSNASSGASYINQTFSASSSNVSSNGKQLQHPSKPAKLAIQAPSGRILRLTRKSEHVLTTSSCGGDLTGDGPPDGSVWETVIKVGERGVWRGLVLADRSARWCVFGEWECF